MSNFRILHPHIPFFDGLKTPLVGDEQNTIMGSPRTYFEDDAATEFNIYYEAGSSPLLDQYYTPDYFAIVGARNMFDVESNWDWIVRITSGVVYSDNGSWTESDLINNQILFEELSFSLAADATEYNVRLQPSNSVALKLSKVFLGKAFDFGREPVYNTSQVVKRFERISVLKSGILTFEAVSATTAQNWVRYIVPYLNQMTFILLDDSTCVFDVAAVYCKILMSTVTWDNDHEARIDITFEELA